MPKSGSRLTVVCLLVGLLMLCAWFVRMARLSIPLPQPWRLP